MTVGEVISVYEEKGKEACNNFLFESCNVDFEEELPRDQLNRFVLSIIAKYKNLLKHESSDSAKEELKRFQCSDVISLISSKRRQAASGLYLS